MILELSPRQERLLLAIFERGHMRSLAHAPQDPPPADWGAQHFGIVRPGGGILAALHFPHPDPRGIVLFGHPGIPPAKGYFHRSDRIPFVQALGFAAMSFDHGGFGESDDPTALWHREWTEALRWARRRYPALPIHVWGVSLGGYFAHHALAQDEQGIKSAIFEQVTPDLLAYAPTRAVRAAAALLGLLSPDARAWEAATTHAPRMAVEQVLYVSGGRDHGITPAQAEALVAAAGPFARHHVVAEAGHLEAWKLGGDAVRGAVEKVLLSS